MLTRLKGHIWEDTLENDYKQKLEDALRIVDTFDSVDKDILAQHFYKNYREPYECVIEGAAEAFLKIIKFLELSLPKGS